VSCVRCSPKCQARLGRQLRHQWGQALAAGECRHAAARQLRKDVGRPAYHRPEWPIGMDTLRTQSVMSYFAADEVL
jgi:hypothetical protein